MYVCDCVFDAKHLRRMLCYKLVELHLESHMFMFFVLSEGGRGEAGAAQSVNALYFQHEGTHCHVMEQA